MSIRAASRITGLHKQTIMSLLILAGEKAQAVLDSRVQRVRSRYVQMDELWTFVHTKEGHLAPGNPAEWSDAYTWVALDATTKLVISHLVGKRDAEHANTFVRDVSNRIAGRCQVTSDGFRPYISAVEEAWGPDVDFAQLVKVYGKPDNAGPDWYGPGKVIETIPTPISGDPDVAHICTSHVQFREMPERLALRIDRLGHLADITRELGIAFEVVDELRVSRAEEPLQRMSPDFVRLY